jgi:hypothetical protein
VARAYVEPGLYELIGDASSLGRPEVVDIAVDGDTAVVELRYHFTGELNAAARAALDPDKLSWVEHSTHDLARHRLEFRLVPDHYRDRFKASGDASVAARGAGSVRTVRGSLSVKAPLVGRAVEKAIVSGLRDHLAAEAKAVDRFLAGG